MTKEKIARALRQVYLDTTTEPVPAKLKALLAKLR
jgi:hypothetical protein